MFRYTKEQKQFLRENVVGRSYRELMDTFNEHFDTNISYTQIKDVLHRMRLSNGRDGGFKKGNTPHNKGRPRTEWMTKEGIEQMKKTEFKRGCTPLNLLPIGSETICHGNDYVYIKNEEGRWQLKSRWVYEKHYGMIPEGYKVTFVDGDKHNFDINNLMLITTSEQAIMNNLGLYSKDAELNKSGILIAKVLNKINKKERK